MNNDTKIPIQEDLPELINLSMCGKGVSRVGSWWSQRGVSR